MSDASSTVRYDELNLARLNLISAQDAVNGQSTWSEGFEHEGRVMTVTCTAGPGMEIPHGVDNDISAALLELFVEVGMPVDGVLEVPASELRRRAGFHRGGHYVTLLRTSLDRLYHTDYNVSSGWRDHAAGRWTNRRFRIVSALEYTSTAAQGQFDERTMLRIQLGEPLVLSMRAGYVKALNLSFMRSLSRPRTRVLFRALDAMRYDPEQPEITVNEYRIGLIEWSDHLKIPSGRPDQVRRALKPLHEELIRRGYLLDVDIEGRGSKQTLTYKFMPDFAPVSPAVLDAMRRHGVSEGVARSLAATRGGPFIMQHVALFEHLLTTQQLTIKKTRAAALVHLLKNPEQYRSAPARPAALPVEARKPVAAVTPPPEAGDDVAHDFAGLDAEAQADLAIKRLNLMYRKHFSTAELDEIRHRVLHGELHAVTLVREGALAHARLEAQAFVDLIRALVRAPAQG